MDARVDDLPAATEYADAANSAGSGARPSIGVMDISRQLRLSHPLIVRMARKFADLRLATIRSDPKDARRRLLVPTAKGREQAAKLRAFNARLAPVFDSLCAEIDYPLIEILDRLDAALEAAPIAARLSNPPDEKRSV